MNDKLVLYVDKMNFQQIISHWPLNGSIHKRISFIISGRSLKQHIHIVFLVVNSYRKQ